jgi:uncharacterized membrane protein YpjA
MAFIRSVLHALLMLVTVIPWGIWMVTASLWANGEQHVLEGRALAALADRRRAHPAAASRCA